MQKTMSKPFMTMVLTALICLVLLFLCYLMIGSKIAFFGWYTLWVLLILDLIALASFIFVSIVFRTSNGEKTAKYTAIMTTGIIAATIIIIMSNPLRRSS